jgi:outer membrane protein assembly factor BamB
MNLPLKIFAVVILSSAAPRASAHTFCQVGVDSNLLIDSGRVVFAQADGSLTMLALEDGRVLKREKSRYFSGTLERIPQGILMLQYGSIALLDATNLTAVWETTSYYQANVLSTTLVSYDGNGLVEHRNLNDGTVRWTYNLPGALEVIAEGERVLVHRAATYEDQNSPITVMLNLESGEELFRKSPPPGVHWLDMYFDRQSVYVKQASFAGKRSDYKLEGLSVWNVQGEEVRSIPFTAKMREDLRWADSPCNLEQKTFYRGRVYPDRWAIPRERFGHLLPTTGDQTNEISETAYDLKDGWIFTERRKSRHGRESSETEIELRSPEGCWTGVLTYLSDRGLISAIARAPGRILIGSNLGHVECIKASTGESLWLYVFPTIRHTMSFSSYGMPPMMSQAAATFRDENANPPKTGLKLLDQDARPARVILDPEPTDPFKKLPLLFAAAWGGAVLVLLAVAFLHAHPRIRQRNLGLLSVLLVLLAFLCFMSYGRVSPGSSTALRVAILAGLVSGTLDTARCFRRGKWLMGAALAGVFLAVALLLFPFLLRM